MTPKPHAIERADALPALTRFLPARRMPNWSGCRTACSSGAQANSSPASPAFSATAPMTVVDGGVAQALALSAADNNAGSLTVKVLRANAGAAADRPRARLRPQGICCSARRASRFKPRRPRDRSFGQSAGRDPKRHRAARNRQRTLGRRRAIARQALAPQSVGVITGATADTAQPLLASTFYLQRALGPFADVRMGDRVSPSDAVIRFIDQNVPMLILADVGNVVRPRARAARQMDRGWRRAAALRGSTARGLRRRTRPGAAAPRRPHARRLAVLGEAAAARSLLARRSVRRHGGAGRRHCQSPGAGGAGCRHRRAHLGNARRRHAAGYRQRGAARE